MQKKFPVNGGCPIFNARDLNFYIKNIKKSEENNLFVHSWFQKKINPLSLERYIIDP